MASHGIRRRHVLARLAGGAAALALPGWVGAAKPALALGLSLPLSAVTGSGAATVTNILPDIGLDYLAGFSAALETDRRGAAIEVVALDDQLDVATSRANIDRLAKQGVLAVSGLWTAEQTRAVLPLLAASGLPAVGIRSGDPELRSGAQPQLFHLRPGYDDELASAVKVLAAMGFGRLGVLHAGDDFGAANLKRLKALAQADIVPMQVGAGSADAAARELAGRPGVQALLLLTPAAFLAPVMTGLRRGASPYLAPVCTLSHVLSTSLAASRDTLYQGLAVTCPYPNPLLWSAGIAVRFRKAMQDRGLDHADRSFAAFEGFIAGALLARAVGALGNSPSREALANELRAHPHQLGGLSIAFDSRQVGHRQVSFLFKSGTEGYLRA